MTLSLGALKLKRFLEGRQPAPPSDKNTISTHTDKIQIIYNALFYKERYIIIKILTLEWLQNSPLLISRLREASRRVEQ
jgi:hypothetical protein